MIRIGPSRRGAGFTLVELQIALLLMALISLLLLGGLRVATQTWSRVGAQQDQREHFFLFDQMLRRHLQNMRFETVTVTEPLSATDAQAGDSITSFLAGEDYLHFVAPWPGFRHQEALYWWTLKSEWNDAEGKEQLILDYQPFDARKPPFVTDSDTLVVEDQRVTRLVVADNIELLGTTFLGDRDGEGAQWIDEWVPGDDEPLAVQIRLAAVDAEGELADLPLIALIPHHADQEIRAWEED